jgi:hypothetical protein
MITLSDSLRYRAFVVGAEGEEKRLSVVQRWIELGHGGSLANVQHSMQEAMMRPHRRMQGRRTVTVLKLP